MTTLWPEQRLQEVEARCRAATPGPWEIDGLHVCEPPPDPPGTGYDEILFSANDETRPEDLRFVAEARSDLADAVAEIRRLQEKLRAATHCRNCREFTDDMPLCAECRF